MQKNTSKYETQGLGKNLVTWGLVGLMGIVNVFNIGCGDSWNQVVADRIARRDENARKRAGILTADQRFVNYIRLASNQGRLSLCGKTDENIRNQNYINQMCEEGVIAYESNPKKEMHLKGQQIYLNQQIAQRASQQQTSNQDNNNNNNQNNNDNVIDDATGRSIGNLSTMGWMKFFEKYGKE
tara:strand:- start:400 stop:948 length:549 start_codon:yes stop_codon:yes gene_type:complete